MNSQIPKALTLLLTILAAFALPGSAVADTFNATYLGGGIWEQDPNWSTTVYPNNGRTRPGPNGEPIPGPDPLYNVIIDNPAPCTLGSGLLVRVQNVNVLSGSTLNLANGHLRANTGLGNAGLITLNSTGSVIFSVGIRLDANSAVVNGGEIFMNDGPFNFVTGGGPAVVFTVAAGGRIRGAGSLNAYLGDDVRFYVQWINHGLIEAMQPNNPLRIQLTDDPAFTNSMINDGTVRASGQGVLLFSNFNNFANVLNEGGTIEAIDNGTVRVLSRSTITGGTLATSGNGTIRGDVNGGTFNNVLNTGTMVVGDGENFVLAGTFTNNGTLTMTGASSSATLRFADGTVLAGTGTLTLAGSGPNYVMARGGTEAMTIASDATLQGHGNISPGFAGGSDMLRITNQGLVHANISGATLSIRAEASNNTPFTNSGTLRASNGATLAFSGSSTLTNNGGTLHVLAGSTISMSGGITLLQTAGTIDLDGGTMSVPAGVDLNGGQLIGNGTFVGPIRNHGGIVGPGHSAGKITVTGNYNQDAGGVMTMEIGGPTPGTQYDQLEVTGTAALGGILNISLINGFVPAVGDVFQILSTGSSSGSFATVNTTGFTGQVNYSASSITMTVLTVGGGTPTPTPTPSKLLNIATRMRVQTGENVIIGGFIIAGTDTKNVIIRGIGPSLSSFFSGVLANPTLELFQGSTLLQSNNDWKDTQRTEIEGTGLQPSNDFESAIVRTLLPGSYTAVLRGLSDTTGIAVVEAYDLNQAVNSKLANIATRGFVEAGDNVMIGGLIIGPAGGSTARVVVRAIGPSLTAFGIAGALQDPSVELKDVNGTTLSSNDDWMLGQPTEIQQLGLAPGDTRESALVTTLAPGSYTAIVRGVGNTTGVGLVEVYHVQ